jgi:hypothetical protein
LLVWPVYRNEIDDLNVHFDKPFPAASVSGYSVSKSDKSVGSFYYNTIDDYVVVVVVSFFVFVW